MDEEHVELTDLELKNYILKRVMDYMGWTREKAILWYRTKNPHLGNASPCEMVGVGRGHKVLRFIENAEMGD